MLLPCKVDIITSDGRLSVDLSGEGVHPALYVSKDKMRYGIVGIHFPYRDRLLLHNECALPLRLEVVAQDLPSVFQVSFRSEERVG